ncbi:SMI1/KNR4 family protein, partial [Pseudorhodobacter sp.]|uniref:SMI1/KNR4 family protein n=1 Tax=Pseudorhodobacter sp. TaxID=1934400 RepID=UPI002648F070
DPASVDEFQKLNSIKLPDDYVDYLVKYNGGLFRKSIFLRPGKPEVDTSVHIMYGLHEGPDGMTTDQIFKLSKHSDLSDFENEFEHLFVFGQGEGGENLLLNLETGCVCLFDSNFSGSLRKAQVVANIIILANSFTEFVTGLQNFDEYLSCKLAPTERVAFEKRLEELGRQFDDEAEDYKE